MAVGKNGQDIKVEFTDGRVAIVGEIVSGGGSGAPAGESIIETTTPSDNETIIPEPEVPIIETTSPSDSETATP